MGYQSLTRNSVELHINRPINFTIKTIRTSNWHCDDSAIFIVLFAILQLNSKLSVLLFLMMIYRSLKMWFFSIHLSIRFVNGGGFLFEFLLFASRNVFFSSWNQRSFSIFFFFVAPSFDWLNNYALACDIVWMEFQFWTCLSNGFEIIITKNWLEFNE